VRYGELGLVDWISIIVNCPFCGEREERQDPSDRISSQSGTGFPARVEDTNQIQTLKFPFSFKRLKNNGELGRKLGILLSLST